MATIQGFLCVKTWVMPHLPKILSFNLAVFRINGVFLFLKKIDCFRLLINYSYSKEMYVRDNRLVDGS